MANTAKRRTPSTRAARSSAGTAQRLRHADRREEIIQVATDVFARDGFSAGTTSEIANRVGLTQPALYHYMGSKDSLLAEICQRMGEQLQGVLDEVLARKGLSAAERLAAFIDGYARTVIQTRGAMSVRATEARHLPARMLRKIHAEEREYMASVEKLVAAACKEGALPKGLDTRVATRALFGMMNWTFMWYRAEESSAEDTTVDTMSALILGRH